MDIILKYSDVQGWFMDLDDNHTFLTSLCLGNIETKPNGYFIASGIMKTKEKV